MIVRPGYVTETDYTSQRINRESLEEKRTELSKQPRPQGLLLVENGGSGKAQAKAAEILQESWSILSRDT